MTPDYQALQQFIHEFGWPGLLYITGVYGGHKVWVFIVNVYWPTVRQDKDRWYAQIDKLTAGVESCIKELVELRRENKAILALLSKNTQGEE